MTDRPARRQLLGPDTTAATRAGRVLALIVIVTAAALLVAILLGLLAWAAVAIWSRVL